MAVPIGAAAKAAAARAGGALFRGGVVAFTLVTPVFAQSAQPDVLDRAAGARAAGEGACEFVRGVAAAEADVLLGPELFGRYGASNITELATDGNVITADKSRLTLGVNYSLGHLYQGITVRRRGDAECRRERAKAGLDAALYAGTDYAKGPALDARAQVLKSVIPEGERLVEAVREDMRKGSATAEELQAAQLRLDALRALATETALERERLPPSAAQPPAQPGLADLLQEFRTADDEVEQIAGRLRGAAAWDLSLRGAYDKIFQTQQNTPFTAMVMVSYNLGGLFQPSANARAREGRSHRAAEDLAGIERRASEVLRQLRAMRSAEQTRVRDVSVLTADLEQQLDAVRKLQTAKVRRFSELLWFELARLRAERTFLEVHVKDIARVLGEPVR
jgi:hypothetical protein